MYHMRNLKSMNRVLQLDHRCCPGDVLAYQTRGKKKSSEMCLAAQKCKTVVYDIQINKMFGFGFF